MQDHAIVSRNDWLAARLALLEREKAFTRARDALSAERRALPWVEVTKDYAFDTSDGKKSLSELFANHSQLIIYHFMYGPDWPAGCKSCSFWADSFNGNIAHLAARDVTLVAVSRAPLDMLSAFKKRMGWQFEWVSSLGSDFNFDFEVSFPEDAREKNEIRYNYGPSAFPADEAPGISVFFKDGDGKLYHTYSTFARGLDMLNTGYHFLDLVPKGRNEDSLSYSMEWVRLRDEYGKT
ncbi:MAG: thioredoxin family protein [Pseudomonadota bacterium]